MRSSHLFTISFFSLFIILGILLRAEPMLHWQDNPNDFFANEKPVLANLDGYYYLNIAKEIGENSYSSIDTKRAYPETVNRSSSPSLLPVLLHYTSSIFQISLNWVAIWLPVFLGISLLLPVYLISKLYGGTITAIGALAFAALSPYYVVRTRLGWLDTDCMNVVLPLLCTYCFMQFGLLNTQRRYIFLSSGIFFFMLFLWWWDMTPGAVTALALSPLAIALLCHYRPEKKEGTLFFILATAIIVIIFLSIDISQIISTGKSLLSQLSYISKKSSGLFPNIGLSIQEQKSFSLQQSFSTVAPNLLVLIIVCCGFVFLCFKQSTKILYLLPMAILGGFSFFYAKRFAIFLTPIYAISFGYFFLLLSKHIQKRYLLYILYTLVIIYFSWSSYGISRNQPVIMKGDFIEGMQAVQKKTPPASVIWSWWDEGHPLVYWGDRATLSDGMIHGGARSFFTAVPLVTTDFRLAANFMQFYTARGISGINLFIKATGKDFDEGMNQLTTILSLGPIDGKSFLKTLSVEIDSVDSPLRKIGYYYPRQTTPVYLFLDERMLKVFRWIFWLGTWDTVNQTGMPTLPVLKLKNITFDENGQPTRSGMSLEMNKGLLTVKGALPDINKIDTIAAINADDSYYPIYTRNLSKEYHYVFGDKLQQSIDKMDKLTDSGSYEVLLDIPRKKMTIMDSKLAGSVMFQLFTYGDRKSYKYFKPVDTTSDHYQIWKIIGDTL